MKPKAHSCLSEYLRTRNSIYRSFGCKKHLIISGQTTNHWRNKYSSEIRTPEQLEKFTVDGIRIGDLIYDTYLRRTKQASIDLNSNDFEEVFDECISYLINFNQLFEKYQVKAVSVSHCVYHFAIPLRIAISRGVDAFQITGESLYRMNEVDTHAYTSFKYFKAIFPTLYDEYIQKEVEIENELVARFSGNISKHMPYSTKSAFEKTLETKDDILGKNNKLKILVAIHDFYDSPHSYGDNFYPDFHIWLRKLGEISEKTDYDWYVKTHRDPLADASQVLESFCLDFPKFTILNRDLDHRTLIAQGIDFALTVYGTIAMEYPYFGIPVINASRNNPHVSFNFSHTPESREDYERVLLNLQNFTMEIDMNEIHQYYFMAHVYPLRSIVFRDHDRFIAQVGGYSKAIGLEAVKFWLDNPEERIPSKELDLALRNFVYSQDFQFSKNHFFSNT